MLEEIMTRPRVKPMDCAEDGVCVSVDQDICKERAIRTHLTVDQPESDETRPSGGCLKGKESHQSGSENTKKISSGDTDDSTILEFGAAQREMCTESANCRSGESHRDRRHSRDDTSDQKGDDLKRSTSTVEKRSVESGEPKTFNDWTRKVCKNTVGNRTSKHG